MAMFTQQLQHLQIVAASLVTRFEKTQIPLTVINI